jgi:CheY-like chemotaxis protein
VPTAFGRAMTRIWRGVFCSGRSEGNFQGHCGVYGVIAASCPRHVRRVDNACASACRRGRSGLRSVLDRGLHESGYRVDVAPDGERALLYLDPYEYEVAIVDWRMPKVSGLEIVRRLRLRGSALPVLMLTARDAAPDRVIGLDEGADDYLVRQFEFSELLARVRALQRRGKRYNHRSLRSAISNSTRSPVTSPQMACGRISRQSNYLCWRF